MLYDAHLGKEKRRLRGESYTRTIKEFMAIMRVTDDLLPTITTPALIFQSTEDHVVTTSSRPRTALTYWRSSAAKTKSWSG